MIVGALSAICNLFGALLIVIGWIIELIGRLFDGK